MFMWGLKLVEDIGHVGAAEGSEQLEWVRMGLNGQGGFITSKPGSAWRV